MLSLSDTESGDRNVKVEVGDENSGKAGNDKELGDCSSWDEDKSETGKLSCLSAKVWYDLTIRWKLLFIGWIKHSRRGTGSFFS